MDATLAQMLDPNWWTGWRMAMTVIVIAVVISIAKTIIKD